MLPKHNLSSADFEKILSYKDILKANGEKLAKLDPNDDYWKYIVHPTELVRNGIFLETNMVTSWIGATRKPLRILEIGTRTGGSLIALLCVYSPEDLKKIEEIVSFDMWREYVSTTPLASFVSKVLGKKSNINLSERVTGFMGGYIERSSKNKVKKNLAAFNIPSDKINFVSGDSKVTVPAFFKQNPGKKFDYILVDGGHDDFTAETDLENVVNYVAPKGIILFDDIMPESYNLINVWNKFKEKHSSEFDFFQIDHRKGMAWAVKK
jgi:predicted O-methyltransferase YrrM